MSLLSFFGVNNPRKVKKIAVYVDPTIDQKAIDTLKEFFENEVSVVSTFNGTTKFSTFFLAPYSILYSGEKMEKVKENATAKYKIIATALGTRLMGQVKEKNEKNEILVLPTSATTLTKKQIEFLQQITTS